MAARILVAGLMATLAWAGAAQAQQAQARQGDAARVASGEHAAGQPAHVAPEAFRTDARLLPVRGTGPAGSTCAPAANPEHVACPPRVHLEAPTSAATSVLRRAAAYYGLANLAEGALGFFGPAVTGTGDDELINTETGEIFGVSAINPAHAALHVAWGGAGFLAQRSDPASSAYMKASTVLFGALTVAGFVRGGDTDDEIYRVAGLALDTEANLIHALITGAAAYFGFVH